MSMQSRVPLGPGKFHVVVLVKINTYTFQRGHDFKNNKAKLQTGILLS